MRETIRLATTQAQVLVDITDAVRAVVSRSGIRDGLVHVYAQGATAAIMIQHGRGGNRSANPPRPHRGGAWGLSPTVV
ncbi:hypothetical protein F2Q65_19325, partial [Thiohalocapsa marina]